MAHPIPAQAIAYDVYEMREESLNPRRIASFVSADRAGNIIRLRQQADMERGQWASYELTYHDEPFGSL